MGFFSYQCPCCKHSILNPYSIIPSNGWMSDCIALFPNGSRVIGSYDGYGNITGPDGDEHDISFADPDMKVLHTACWKATGQKEFDAYDAPQHSADQGYFFDDIHYVHDRPTSEEDIKRIAKDPPY